MVEVLLPSVHPLALEAHRVARAELAGQASRAAQSDELPALLRFVSSNPTGADLRVDVYVQVGTGPGCAVAMTPA